MSRVDTRSLVADRTVALPAARRSDAYVVAGAILALMLISTLDVLGRLDRPIGAVRYSILLIPYGAALWIRISRPSFVVRRPTTGDAITASLFLFGFLGSLFGLAFRGTVESAIAVFAPMAIGLTYLVAREGLSDAEVRRVFRGLSAIALVYVLLNFGVNTGILARLVSASVVASRLTPLVEASLKYRNASAAFVALAFACAIVERRRLRIAALVVLYAAIFAKYPSATQVLIGCAVGLTLFLTARRASELRTVVVAGLIVAFAAVALLNFNTGVDVTSRYFAQVSKANADNGRLDLWLAGIDQFRQSPIVGTVFSADAVAQRARDLKVLPFHNDFVLFLAEGGLVGSGLLLGWMVYAELTILRRYRGFVRVGDAARANLLRVLLVMLNSFFVAMAFNPVLEGVTRTATIFGVYAIAMLVGEPPPVSERQDVTATLSVRAAPSS